MFAHFLYLIGNAACFAILRFDALVVWERGPADKPVHVPVVPKS